MNEKNLEVIQKKNKEKVNSITFLNSMLYMQHDNKQVTIFTCFQNLHT